MKIKEYKYNYSTKNLLYSKANVRLLNKNHSIVKFYPNFFNKILSINENKRV
jgi:hypothetical protein